MLWPQIERVRSALSLAIDVDAYPLGRSDVAAWTEALRCWQPDLAIGSMKSLLEDDVYNQYVALSGERDTEDRALYVLLLRSPTQIIAGIVLEFDEGERVIHSHLSVVAPAWRGRGLGRVLLRAGEAIGLAMGAGRLWGLVDLENAPQQQLLRSEGWWLSGIIPDCFQRRIVGGAQRFAPYAYYSKPLLPAENLIWPEPGMLSAQVAALFEALQLPGSPLPITGSLPRPPSAPSSRQLDAGSEQRPAQRPPGTWPPGEDIAAQLELPAGFRVRQQARRDIEFLIDNLGEWHPRLARSAHRALLTPHFHQQSIALAGEYQGIDERPFFCFVIEHNQQIVGIFLIWVIAATGTLIARFGIVDPRYQRRGLMQRVLPSAFLMSKALGMEALAARVPLRHTGAQHMVERLGWQLWGIVPSTEICGMNNGREQRWFEALYGLSLIAPEHTYWPAEEQLSRPLQVLTRFVRGLPTSQLQD